MGGGHFFGQTDRQTDIVVYSEVTIPKGKASIGTRERRDQCRNSLRARKIERNLK